MPVLPCCIETIKWKGYPHSEVRSLLRVTDQINSVNSVEGRAREFNVPVSFNAKCMLIIIGWSLNVITWSSEPFLQSWDQCFHSQLPGEFHGGCPRRLYARQQTPRPASYHSSSNLHCPNTHHLPSGQTSETDHASPTRGGGGTSKPYHLSRALQYAIPGVGKRCPCLFHVKKNI